jgi:hypothetical protein
MAAIEIRHHEGDFSDIAELGRRVWIPEYGGRIWVVVPDADILGARLAASTGAYCLAAYDGGKLVGSVAALPQTVRVGSAVHSIALCTFFTADPAHRNVALPLIERLRRENEERGVSFATGMVLEDARSASFRFWSKYQQAFPQNFRLLFRGGYWAKFLEPRLLARASIEAWERTCARMLGPVLRMRPLGDDAPLRPYRAADLARCVELIERAWAGLDWAQTWSASTLSYHLINPAMRSFVLERDGEVHALASYSWCTLLGREPIRAAMINLWADAGLGTGERARMLGRLCRIMREDDMHAVVAVRSAMIPAAALVANVFIPASQNFHVGIFPTPRTGPLQTPRNWSLEVT